MRHAALAPIAQRIEHRPPEPGAGVRVALGAPSNTAYLPQRCSVTDCLRRACFAKSPRLRELRLGPASPDRVPPTFPTTTGPTSREPTKPRQPAPCSGRMDAATIANLGLPSSELQANQSALFGAVRLQPPIDVALARIAQGCYRTAVHLDVQVDGAETLDGYALSQSRTFSLAPLERFVAQSRVGIGQACGEVRAPSADTAFRGRLRIPLPL
jgi:hypothetical protein